MTRTDSPSSPLPMLTPADRRALLIGTARQLAQAHGKQAMYDHGQVGQAVARASFPSAWAPWATALFGTQAEFAAHCARDRWQGDYQNTRAASLRALGAPREAEHKTAALGAAGLLVAGAASQVPVALPGPADAPFAGARETLDNIGVTLDILEGIGDIFEFLGSFG